MQIQLNRPDGTKQLVNGIITDVSPEGFGLFADEFIPSGTHLYLSVDEEVFKGTLCAQTAWCQKVNTSKSIIKQTPMTYRLGVAAAPQTEDEKKFLALLHAKL